MNKHLNKKTHHTQTMNYKIQFVLYSYKFGHCYLRNFLSAGPVGLLGAKREAMETESKETMERERVCERERETWGST